MTTAKTTCSCGGPVALYCHTCHRPVCWKCFHGFLVAHCADCWRKHGERPNPGTGDLFTNVPAKTPAKTTAESQ